MIKVLICCSRKIFEDLFYVEKTWICRQWPSDSFEVNNILSTWFFILMKIQSWKNCWRIESETSWSWKNEIENKFFNQPIFCKWSASSPTGANRGSRVRNRSARKNLQWIKWRPCQNGGRNIRKYSGFKPLFNYYKKLSNWAPKFSFLRLFFRPIIRCEFAKWQPRYVIWLGHRLIFSTSLPPLGVKPRLTGSNPDSLTV